jgi:urease accessory protein
MPIIATKKISKFLQILDSSFPSGTFVHSFGLEPYVVLEKIKNEDDLKLFLQNIIIDQYVKFEFVFARKVHGLFGKNRLNQIIKEDNQYSCMLNFEFAKASSDIGHNYLRHLEKTVTKEIVKNYFSNIKNKNSVGNEISVLSAYAFDIDFGIDMFLLMWCKKNIINISQTALKISIIKPSNIQKILFELDEFISEQLKIKNKNIENFNPLFEEIIYQHKSLEPKMFVT